MPFSPRQPSHVGVTSTQNSISSVLLKARALDSLLAKYPIRLLHRCLGFDGWAWVGGGRNQTPAILTGQARTFGSTLFGLTQNSNGVH